MSSLADTVAMQRKINAVQHRHPDLDISLNTARTFIIDFDRKKATFAIMVKKLRDYNNSLDRETLKYDVYCGVLPTLEDLYAARATMNALRYEHQGQIRAAKRRHAQTSRLEELKEIAAERKSAPIVDSFRALLEERKNAVAHAAANDVPAPPRIRYVPMRRGADAFNGSDPCAICLSEYDDDEETRLLDCHHLFHTECLNGWLETSYTCPSCRAPIPEDNSLIDDEAVEDNEDVDGGEGL